MTTLTYNLAGKTRNDPLSTRLIRILNAAGKLSGIDGITIQSAGQMGKAAAIAAGAVKGTDGIWRLSTGERVRVGSTRHDFGNAADIDLYVSGQLMKFTTTSGRQTVADFLKQCAALGCTGIGAGPGYMGGEARVHVGFGSKTYWGKHGKRENAPSWLIAAVTSGWNNPIDIDDVLTPLGVSLTTVGRHEVIAPSGLNLRGGPGTSFPDIGTLPFGTEVDVVERDGSWAKVDLLSDGTPDGHVYALYLRQVA